MEGDDQHMSPIDPTGWIPDNLKKRIIDGIVSLFAEKAEKAGLDDVSRTLKQLRSDAEFLKAVDQGLRRATDRFVKEYKTQDRELALAIAGNPGFWENLEVQSALLEIVRNPGIYLDQQQILLMQSFASVLAQRADRERINHAVSFYLRCVAESLWHLEPLRPAYELYMQRLSLERATEMAQEIRGMRTDLRGAMVALVQAIYEQQNPLKGSEKQGLLAPTASPSVQNPKLDVTDRASGLVQAYSELRRKLANSFTDDGLNTLCFDLGVDYEALPGSDIEAKSREIVKYFRDAGRIPDLVERCSVLRSGVTWETAPESTKLLMLDVVDSIDRAIQTLKGHVGNSEYDKAVQLATEHRKALISSSFRDNCQFQLALAEFDVWHAHALMYTGKAAEAMQLLEDVIARVGEQCRDYQSDQFERARWNIVLGRAHNHIGYIHWVDQGHYEFALEKFRAAIGYFLAAKPNPELATAYDNMGRVYAEVGYQTRAELLIEHGRQLREELPDIPRRALSLNSNAIAHLAFGQPNHALILSEEAIAIFGEHKNSRGVGLALLTKGRSLRYLAAHTYLRDGDPKSNLEKLEVAERALYEARNLFEEIGETIRRFQAYNELGCAKRERARLLMRQGDRSGALRAAGAAIELLKQSIDVTGGEKCSNCTYPTHYVDACVDLAETCLLMGDQEAANNWIESALKVAPADPDLDAGVSDGSIDPIKCFEDFWQQLGKIAALRGHMTFAGNLSEAIEHYTVAAGYFGRFLERPLSPYNGYLYPHYRPHLENHRIFREQLYHRLKDLEPEHWREIKEKISETARLSAIRDSWLLDFYEDTLDFLLAVNVAKHQAS